MPSWFINHRNQLAFTLRKSSKEIELSQNIEGELSKVETIFNEEILK